MGEVGEPIQRRRHTTRSENIRYAVEKEINMPEPEVREGSELLVLLCLIGFGAAFVYRLTHGKMSVLMGLLFLATAFGMGAVLSSNRSGKKND